MAVWYNCSYLLSERYEVRRKMFIMDTKQTGCDWDPVAIIIEERSCQVLHYPKKTCGKWTALEDHVLRNRRIFSSPSADLAQKYAGWKSDACEKIRSHSCRWKGQQHFTESIQVGQQESLLYSHRLSWRLVTSLLRPSGDMSHSDNCIFSSYLLMAMCKLSLMIEDPNEESLMT